MRHKDFTVEQSYDMENLMSVCCGSPRGDELPQAPGLQDILMDVYSDALNMPREFAAGRMHHQYDDDFDYEGFIH